MKHGIVIGLAPDRRSGRVLGCLVSADEAIRFVKDAITENRCPDARFPILVAVSTSSVLRQHRFTVSAAQVKGAEEHFGAVAIPAAESIEEGATGGAVELLKNDIGQRDAAIEAHVAEIESCKAEVIKRDSRIKELEGQLAEAVKSAAKKK